MFLLPFNVSVIPDCGERYPSGNLSDAGSKYEEVTLHVISTYDDERHSPMTPRSLQEPQYALGLRSTALNHFLHVPFKESSSLETPGSV